KENLQSQLNQVVNILSGTPFEDCFDRDKADAVINAITPDPLIEMSGLESQLEKDNETLRKFDMYERDMSEYNKWVKDGKEAKEEAEKRDKAVKAIEKKRSTMIASAKMPEGFEMGDDGLLYNGFPLSEKQISQSAKYIAALKLGEMI